RRPCGPPADGPQGHIVWKCSWLHPLKVWSLRESRDGSVNGVAEVFRVRLAYGLSVKSTGNHLWFVKAHYTKVKLELVNAWVATENLTPGDVLGISVGIYTSTENATLKPLKTTALCMRGAANPNTQPTKMNPDLAWLLGYLWGDGSMSPLKYRLRWLDRNTDNLVKANQVFKVQFDISGNIYQRPKKDAHFLEIGNVELWHWLIKNGLFKYHADEIDQIPLVVRASSKEDIIAFLTGLMDADGAIARQKDKTVILAAAQESFARHVQNIGWAVGVAFGMSHNTVGKNWQQVRKSMFLMTMSAAARPEVIELLVKHSNKRRAADAEPRLWRCDRVGRSVRRTMGKVERVESIGDMPTFDCEVSDNHWFYAGAVKFHNTATNSIDV
ncbi:hypothetical protein, partial [Billgrantia antri]|uniref:hypothetical protein n=1 Tax=Billgrantia antri TaxID=2846777 RepID=UPI003B222A1D